MDLEVRTPIFIVGTGRSGSTVFFDLFANHPNVAWLSRLSREYPGRPWLNSLLMRSLSFPVFGKLFRQRFEPSEAYPYWDRMCPGFSNPCRDLLAEDVTPISAERIRTSLSEMVTGTRSRFLAKITGWPRVRYLLEIFPNAVFIEVTRNPCATTSSLLEVPFWDGWRGPPNWRRGQLPADLEAIWRQEGESFVALAAIEYVIVQRAMAQCRAILPPNQMHTVSYSNLCADPLRVFRRALEFCDLESSAQFEKSIKHARLVDRDDQWPKKLTVAQQAILQRTLDRVAEAPRAKSKL